MIFIENFIIHYFLIAWSIIRVKFQHFFYKFFQGITIIWFENYPINKLLIIIFILLIHQRFSLTKLICQQPKRPAHTFINNQIISNLFPLYNLRRIKRMSSPQNSPFIINLSNLILNKHQLHIPIIRYKNPFRQQPLHHILIPLQKIHSMYNLKKYSQNKFFLQRLRKLSINHHIQIHKDTLKNKANISPRVSKRGQNLKNMFFVISSHLHIVVVLVFQPYGSALVIGVLDVESHCEKACLAGLFFVDVDWRVWWYRVLLFVVFYFYFWNWNGGWGGWRYGIWGGGGWEGWLVEGNYWGVVDLGLLRILLGLYMKLIIWSNLFNVI